MQFNGMRDNKSFVDKWDVVMSPESPVPPLERTQPHQSSSSPSADTQPPPSKKPRCVQESIDEDIESKRVGKLPIHTEGQTVHENHRLVFVQGYSKFLWQPFRNHHEVPDFYGNQTQPSLVT